MNTTPRFLISSLSLAMLLVLTGCASMSQVEKDTAYGAAAGGVTGAVLTGGSPLGTAGGAAVGGLIGHVIGKEIEDDK